MTELHGRSLMGMFFLQKCGLLTSLADFFDFVLRKDS